MRNNVKEKNIVIYKGPKGNASLRMQFENDTVWANQAQIIKLFDVDQSVVSRHINNIFKEGEVDKKSNMQKMHIANSDKPLFLYSLDVILSVGYRTNSNQAIIFRKWATSILHKHLIDGYTINRAVIAKNYDSFLEAVSKVKSLLPKENSMQTGDILELINLFANTWFSLDAYDKEKLKGKGNTKKHVELIAGDFWDDIVLLKNTLIGQNEATELFAKEREKGALAGIIGNVMQSFGGKMLYGTVEEKAAHLLYFIIKNHPFVDGNKRTGAYAFIWYLRKAKILNTKKLTPEALTAITLLVAESNPEHKEKLVSVIISLIV